MNRTASFKEAVFSVRDRDLVPVEPSGSDGEMTEVFPVKDKDRILPRTRRKRAAVDELESRGRAIARNVTRLRDFLGENRNAYLDVMNNELRADAVTDLERDRIDAGALDFIRTIHALLNRYKADLKDGIKSMTSQRIKHFEAVTDILDDYLKYVCDIHARQKAIRVEKELELQKFSRLDVKAKKKVETSEDEEDDKDDEGPRTRRKKRKRRSRSPRSPRRTDGYLYSSEEEGHGEEFSPEEVRMLEKENAEMFEDLMTLKDSVKQIETKVVKIAELQEVFASKVLRQKDDIDNIASHAVASTENIKDGNEELRKAIQRNASIRVYILFFLLVMSFSLLFLDWYNE